MTEYVNKEYYKSLAVADRFYINPGNMTRPFMDRLNAEGIPFSATLGDYKQTVTVSKANRERAEGHTLLPQCGTGGTASSVPQE